MNAESDSDHHAFTSEHSTTWWEGQKLVMNKARFSAQGKTHSEKVAMLCEGWSARWPCYPGLFRETSVRAIHQAMIVPQSSRLLGPCLT